MRKYKNSWIYFFILTGTLFLITGSCNKDKPADNAVENGIVFNPDLTYGTISDIDGNTYKTIAIGTQTWMAENLKTTRYNTGEAIPNIKNNQGWDQLTAGAFCWYKNDSVFNKSRYGALYNWYAVHTGKLSPTGWRVATDDDWTILEMFLGMPLPDNTVSRETFDEGNKLKESGTTHWKSPNGGRNTSGFSALPGGSLYNHETSSFGLGDYGYWWTSSEFSTSVPNTW